MARARPAEHTLRLLSEFSTSQYVCRTCRAQQIRRLHASAPSRAEDRRPFTQRLVDQIFGKKTDEESEESEKAAVSRTKELAKQFNPKNPYTQKKAANTEGFYNIAPVIDPDATEHYTAASTWDGLSTIGTREWVKRLKDKGEVYEGYTPGKYHQLENNQWNCLLHNLTVELLLLRKAGRDVNQLWYSRAPTFNQTAAFDIQLSGTGTELKAPNSEAEQVILQAIPREQPTTSHEIAFSPKSLSQWNPATASPWMAIRMLDDATKLAIAKRVTQLTGRRIPDPVITNAATIEDFFNALKIRDRPQKLAQTDEFQRLGAALPNVKLHKNRQTIVHKEKQVGRWKVIEAELNARGLPVLGNNYPQGKTVVEPKASRNDRRLRRLKKAE